MIGQRAIRDGSVFLLTALQGTAFQHRFVKDAFHKFANGLEILTLRFAQWTTFLFLMPLLDTGKAIDLVAILAFLGLIDQSEANIALEIVR